MDKKLSQKDKPPCESMGAYLRFDGAGWSAPSSVRQRFCLVQINPICIHDLYPGSHKVGNKPLSRIVLRVDLGIGT
jgi:hypothetical protein